MTKLELTPWIGDIFICLGLWGIGNKDRRAFIASVIGESLWIISSVATKNWPLAIMCIIFATLAVRSYFKWNIQTS